MQEGNEQVMTELRNNTYSNKTYGKKELGLVAEEKDEYVVGEDYQKKNEEDVFTQKFVLVQYMCEEEK